MPMKPFVTMGDSSRRQYEFYSQRFLIVQMDLIVICINVLHCVELLEYGRTSALPLSIVERALNPCHL